MQFTHKRPFLATAALGALCLLIPPGCGSSSSASPPASGTLPIAAVTPLSEYTPFGPQGSIHVPFYKKHVKDSGDDFAFVIQLDGPVGAAGASIDYSLGGTAIQGVHYQLLTPNPLALPEGATEATIGVDLLPSGQYYMERSLEMELDQATGCTLHEKSFRGELWIRPSVDPPILSVASNQYSVAAGTQTSIELSLSQACQESVSLHYAVDAASDLVEYTLAPSGTVFFAPGQTQASVPLAVGPSAASGSELILNLTHERNGVRYMLPPIDPNLTSNTDLVPQPIHLDENMWTFSVGGVREFEQDDAHNPRPTGWSIPGTPTDTITGGSFWEAGKEDQQLIDLLDQADPNPILDPFSGLPLKCFAIADAASVVPPYLRKSFDASFCGSTPQLYSLPEYARISYYLSLPQGLDAQRAVPFLRIGMRMRTLNMNHWIVFRIGSDGFDHEGNPVTVVPTSLGDIGVWDLGQVDPATDQYGVLEDEFGVRFWHAHRLDANHAWSNPNGGPDVFEVPGQTAGNPIEYPTWLSTADQSLELMGLADLDAATGMGNLPYGLFWEISDDNSIFNGDLKPYFPKRGSWWEPQGHAVLTESTTLTIQVP